MEGILRVSPEQLIATASEFGTTGTTIRNITQSMTDLVTNISSAWAGEDASAYVAKFNGLQSDIEAFHSMIQKHVTQLTEMAASYSETNRTNQNDISSLTSDVIY